MIDIHNDLVKDFFYLSERKRIDFAKRTGVCLHRFHQTTPEIEQAMLTDLQETKYEYVEAKWGVHNQFLTRLKKKYNISTKTKPIPAPHD